MRAELYWITDAPCGRLEIMPRPRAGDWLFDELLSWKSAGVEVVVSLLAENEVAELGLQQEPMLCHDVGLIFMSYPIQDRDVPDANDEFFALIDQLHDHLGNGRGVAIHCRMGIGRSSLVAASLLVKLGFLADDAFCSISRDRGMRVPDTHSQIEWVRSIDSRLRGA